LVDPMVAPDSRLLVERGSTLYLVSNDLDIRYANPGTARALGWESATEPAEHDISALLHPADRPLLAGVVRELQPGGRSRQLQVRMRHSNGGWRTVAVVAHDLTRDDRVGGLLLEGWDITEHLDELRATSLTDPLTGLANRALLGDRLRRSLALLRRNIAPVGLLFVDLNEFKAVNDTYGHPAGDRVLSAVSARIGRVLRPQDTLCRWGGDEFVVLCAELDSPGDAVRVAARVRAVLAGPVALDPQLVPGMPNNGSPIELNVGSSIGIAVTTHPETPAAALIGAADRSMYEAKRSRTGVGPVMVLGGSPVGGQSEAEVGAGRPINLDQASSVTQDQ
jgi:diguanylate cyclase (GGDEF)-like protein